MRTIHVWPRYIKEFLLPHLSCNSPFYTVIYTVIGAMKVFDCVRRFRSVFLTDPQKAILKFEIVAEQQYLEELFERKLRLLDIQLLILVIGSYERIAEYAHTTYVRYD